MSVPCPVDLDPVCSRQVHTYITVHECEERCFRIGQFGYHVSSTGSDGLTSGVRLTRMREKKKDATH